jgi:hypothetical protein
MDAFRTVNRVLVTMTYRCGHTAQETRVSGTPSELPSNCPECGAPWHYSKTDPLAPVKERIDPLARIMRREPRMS